jgi:hypothetical protein
MMNDEEDALKTGARKNPAFRMTPSRHSARIIHHS